MDRQSAQYFYQKQARKAAREMGTPSPPDGRSPMSHQAQASYFAAPAPARQQARQPYNPGMRSSPSFPPPAYTQQPTAQYAPQPQRSARSNAPRELVLPARQAAAYVRPPLASAASATSTLVGSPDSRNGSYKNAALAHRDDFDDKHADPENDRFVLAGEKNTRAVLNNEETGQDRFWKRFSVAQKTSQQQNANGGWLEAEQRKTQGFVKWVWLAGLLILVVVGATLAYHFTHMPKTGGVIEPPTQHNFNLGPATTTALPQTTQALDADLVLGKRHLSNDLRKRHRGQHRLS
ncbi:uncharacterized protein L969DRAFT_53130 [Mixia osmundae IAM 14324]|uniref:Uncharacterized protein n=1 Tax=Mixia osmundae (strain CBS 9802 / IAM 14324 / JCM 22182 / KY 12970) TaxID=764103 RepID=G7DX51_MIXOS|nr:uncharacterized protein L969DRAFT_53130 [Mixia osmundae IAM 14324]KEI37298.1 hypothetical protein L969DRAFT_53130 [Mixia osmundae IAM 14324]GAA95161.1 hypothetical protein E5Q_01816 [Mixia osmundae IAM 14324]